MSRMRMIKPDAASDAGMIRCSHSARYLFLQGTCFFDDQGFHKVDATELRAEVFPGDNMSDAQLLELMGEIIAQGMIERFRVPADARDPFRNLAGHEFWVYVNWSRHQRIDRPNSRYPDGFRALWESSSGRSSNGFMSAAAKRPAGETDWEAARSLAQKHFSGTMLYKTAQDHSLSVKACWLVLSGKIPLDWLATAAEALQKAIKKAKPGLKQGAYLQTCLMNLAREAAPPQDFKRLLAECPDPPKPESNRRPADESAPAGERPAPATAGRPPAKRRSDIRREIERKKPK